MSRSLLATLLGAAVLGLGAPVLAAAPGPALHLGDTGPAVRSLQQDLIKLGYTQVGKADGAFGVRTWLGVTAFLRVTFGSGTGDVTPSVWTAITRALAAGSHAASLSQGDQGTSVTSLQARLIALGYPVGKATGYFGPVTEAALVDFQASHDLPASGGLDAATEKALARLTPSLPAAPSSSTPPTATAPGARPSPGTAPAPGSLHVGGTIGGYRIIGEIDLVATAYGPSLQDNYPYGPFDAYGKPLKPGDVAVDPSVIPMLTHLLVTGYHSPYLPQGGELAWARDTGGAIKGKRIDIFLDGNPQQVSSFGVQHVKAYILGN